MFRKLSITIYLSLIVFCYCTDDEQDNDLNVEYAHYVKQVSDVLESDPEFRKKLNALSNDSDLIGVADHLSLVSHNVRTKLDELKRIEIDRLNKLETKLERLQKVYPEYSKKVEKDHIDTQNHATFEIEDLRKLITKTVEEAKKADEESEKAYRRYKMEKELLRRARLAKIKSKEMREKQRMLDEEKLKRHREHPAVHHPGSEEQLKEVWEKEDKLDPENFEPVTFFKLHDTNGDGHFDINEVEALMQKELGKVYERNNSDDDLVEMEAELRRMRKEVFREMDANRDLMISFAEYMNYIKSSEFKKKDDWKPHDETNNTAFSLEEFEKFAKEYIKKHPEVNYKELEEIFKEEKSNRI